VYTKFGRLSVLCLALAGVFSGQIAASEPEVAVKRWPDAGDETCAERDHLEGCLYDMKRLLLDYRSDCVDLYYRCILNRACDFRLRHSLTYAGRSRQTEGHMAFLSDEIRCVIDDNSVDSWAITRALVVGSGALECCCDVTDKINSIMDQLESFKKDINLPLEVACPFGLKKSAFEGPYFLLLWLQELITWWRNSKLPFAEPDEEGVGSRSSAVTWLERFIIHSKEWCATELVNPLYKKLLEEARDMREIGVQIVQQSLGADFEGFIFHKMYRAAHLFCIELAPLCERLAANKAAAKEVVGTVIRSLREDGRLENCLPFENLYTAGRMVGKSDISAFGGEILSELAATDAESIKKMLPRAVVALSYALNGRLDTAAAGLLMTEVDALYTNVQAEALKNSGRFLRSYLEGLPTEAARVMCCLHQLLQLWLDYKPPAGVRDCVSAMPSFQANLTSLLFVLRDEDRKSIGLPGSYPSSIDWSREQLFEMMLNAGQVIADEILRPPIAPARASRRR